MGNNVNQIFFNAKEVSEVFFQGKLNYSRVLQMTRAGMLPALKMGKSYVYEKSALEIWTEKAFSKPVWVQSQKLKRA